MFLLYKIYYGDTLVYLGRTRQPLKDRLRGHFFKSPLMRAIDVTQVSKIEYAEFPTEADMFLYEIYFINLFKPALNVDDKAKDALTVTLPDVSFSVFEDKIIYKWKNEYTNKFQIEEAMREERLKLIEDVSNLRRRFSQKEIEQSDFWEQYDTMKSRIKEIEKILFDKD